MSAVTARAPAKVNLQLAVGPPRADGYHDVVTVYHAVSLFDEVTVAPAERNSVRSPARARQRPRQRHQPRRARRHRAARRRGTRCQGLPGRGDPDQQADPGRGRAGRGSADAAAALVACNELWRTGLSQAELAELAAGIGSDVAFVLVGGTAIGVGRGERVTPALAAGTYHWVLAFATGGLSTAQVYAACDRIRAAQAGPDAAGAAAAKPAARPVRGTPVPRRRPARPGWTTG